MKAISLHNPWATWIAEGTKTIETRMWATSYRGDLLICSTKKPYFSTYLCGYGLCVVNVSDCRPMTEEDYEAALCPYELGRYSWLLDNIRLVVAFPVKGQQGFFRVDDELITFDLAADTLFPPTENKLSESS